MWRGFGRFILESCPRPPRTGSLTRTPGVCGGKACIAGHRVRVLDIVVWHEHQGMTPDEIVSHVPTISLASSAATIHHCSKRSCARKASKKRPDRCPFVFI
ncbi:MAG: DUF433 domain-containing protein [Acidobacteria bacterium]|nr:DUF433 domain-containing protein [Acidobacteriota bacterium]